MVLSAREWMNELSLVGDMLASVMLRRVLKRNTRQSQPEHEQIQSKFVHVANNRMHPSTKKTIYSLPTNL